MITVIIPVHNGIETLDRAVESVLGQTVRGRGDGSALEIILIDDGSRKETALRCDELAKRPEVCAFHMEDRGVSAARNLGLLHARGEFITFLDDDDAMEPEMLEYLMNLHEETGADICGCGFRSVSPDEIDGEACQSGSVSESSGHVYHGAEIVTGRILQRDTRVWSKLFTREVIGSRRFLEGLTIGEDMLFVVSLVGETTSYAAGRAALYDYTINPKGAMERPFTRSYMDQIRCWDEAEKVIRQNLPRVLTDGGGKATEAAAQLGSLRIVSDILTASKIAKLPDEEWEQYRPEFRICREKLADHRSIPGSMKRIPRDYCVKSVLLEYFPGIYRRIYRSHG